MAEILTIIGYAFDAAGIGLAAFGFQRTWQEFGPPGEGLFGFVPRQLTAAGQAVKRKAGDALRRLRGRRTVGSTVTIEAGFAQGHGSVNARARITAPALAPDFDVRPTIVELDRRLRQLVDTVATAEERLGDDVEQGRHDLGALRRQLEIEVKRLDEQGHHVATEGVRIEASGLLLVAVGLVFQVVGSLLAALAN